MKLTVDSDKKFISFDGARYRVLSERGELHDSVCETYGEIEFANFRSLRGYDLPIGVAIDFSGSSENYRNESFVKITRHSEAVRICLDCSYYFDSWRESVHLMDFYQLLVKNLQILNEIIVDAEADFQQNFAFVSLAADFPLDQELSVGYKKLTKTMKHSHRKTLNHLSATAQELAFGGGAFKLKPYIGRWFEIDLPRIFKSVFNFIRGKA